MVDLGKEEAQAALDLLRLLEGHRRLLPTELLRARIRGGGFPWNADENAGGQKNTIKVD